jgi:hypothetical protein
MCWANAIVVCLVAGIILPSTINLLSNYKLEVNSSWRSLFSNPLYQLFFLDQWLAIAINHAETIQNGKQQAIHDSVRE